jgi:hypothetical protein
MKKNKEPNSISTKISSLLFASAMAAVIFISTFTAITPSILQTAAAVDLPTEEWEIHENGYIGVLRIDSVDPQGVVTGTLEAAPDRPHNITGLYNDISGHLTFYRIINPQDPASIQTYFGVVFRDGSQFADTPDRMAGYFTGLPPGGGNKDQNVWGWYAILRSGAQGALPPEGAEEILPNATGMITTDPSPGIIGPEIGTTLPDKAITPPAGANLTLGGMNDTAPAADMEQGGGSFFGQPTPP